MSLDADKKSEVIKKFSRSESDTGSPEVQIALLTENILALQGHFEYHQKDHHSRQGLIRMVNKRRRLLDYLRKNDQAKYSSVLKELNLRK
ncbi:30S ribosomal protein S15 [SAR86 cluster bacterium]|nr:30S ribosomal protein S15 [SAR86 cluster bacterium]